MAHFHAKDQLWSLLRLICQCLYWFDPIVWLAAMLSRRDCELSCDDRVLKNLDPGSRASYGRALLSLVAPKRAKGQLLSCATTMQLGKKSLRERITLIAKKPNMAAYTLVFVLILSLVLTACTFTSAPVQPEPEPVPEPVQTEPEPVQPEEPPADAEAPQPVEDDPEADFQMAFPMLNYASFQRYLDEHPETLNNGWEHIRINEAGFDDEGTSIETQQGDQVLAVERNFRRGHDLLIFVGQPAFLLAQRNVGLTEQLFLQIHGNKILLAELLLDIRAEGAGGNRLAERDLCAAERGQRVLQILNFRFIKLVARVERMPDVRDGILCEQLAGFAVDLKHQRAQRGVVLCMLDGSFPLGKLCAARFQIRTFVFQC